MRGRGKVDVLHALGPSQLQCRDRCLMLLQDFILGKGEDVTNTLFCLRE